MNGKLPSCIQSLKRFGYPGDDLVSTPSSSSFESDEEGESIGMGVSVSSSSSINSINEAEDEEKEEEDHEEIGQEEICPGKSMNCEGLPLSMSGSRAYSPSPLFLQSILPPSIHTDSKSAPEIIVTLDSGAAL